MELGELGENWDAFGKIDPLWAILTEPEKRWGGWDPVEFFGTGRQEIDRVMKYIDTLGVHVRRQRALDFGCGVGRLTQALCAYFDECAGLDIAPSMIEQARRFNRYGDRCSYFLNQRDDLSLFPDNHFDFILTVIVLQHMDPQYIRAYLAEFMRILAPGGLAYIHVPGQWDQLITELLPPSGYRARISLLKPPRVLQPESEAIVHAQVENMGDAAWPSLGPTYAQRQIRLANRWLDSDGNIAVADDDRVGLPRGGVAPGESVELRLNVRAPAAAGRYSLEVDLVQEGVTWFQDRGSPVARTPVHVRRGRRPLAAIMRRIVGPKSIPDQSAPETGTPQMEMYVLPEPEVRQIVLDNGGRIIDVQERTGGDFRHFFYCVSK